MKVVAIDIGSTWTKGAVFSVTGDEFALQQRAARATTVDNLADGFFAVLHELLGETPLPLIESGQVKLRYSSSAKGGLAVAAVGLVPEVTLEIGKIAAQSAGAKLTQVFAYRLTRQDIANLEATPPDILLLAGGTDGGNADFVLANAQAIAASRIDCDIVYAGNRAVADEVSSILAHKHLRIVDNLLPAFADPNPDAARDAIRAIFLATIVKGKGLDVIMQTTGAEPVPTPYAVLEYTRAIRQFVPGWEDFLLLDMGGATTDVYSVHTETPEAGTILRGMPEPEVKRTVEGDLGMRVSAQATCRVDDVAPKAATTAVGADQEALYRYADMLSKSPDYLPDSAENARLDTLLAGICVGHACARHVGRCAPVYTPDGEVKVQIGRNLSRSPRVIGSGGWLSRASSFHPGDWFAGHRVDKRGRAVLIPGQFHYYRDEQYLFPLLANLAREYPRAAALAGIKLLARH